VIASFFGSGLLLRRVRGSDEGSGTVGAALALGLSLVLARQGSAWQAAATLVVTAAGLIAVREFADGDPGWVVVDEAAGTLLATIGLAPLPAVIAWVVFRTADIFKARFPGVSAAERLPGATGVMADDLVAGIYGLVAGWLVQIVIVS
jgi:phosphatidylglycerophosphatase A